MVQRDKNVHDEEENLPNKSHQFSPVTISPKQKISQGKNLTGNPRIIRDLAAELHSNIQHWNAIHLNGLSLIKTIINLKVDKTYPEELKKPCEDLSKVCDEIDKIIEKLSLIISQMKAVACLHKTKDFLFTTWPVEKFVLSTERIYESYKSEAVIKRTVLENVAHSHKDALKMLHLAAWAYQINIPDDLSVTLESMLVETKLR